MRQTRNPNLVQIGIRDRQAVKYNASSLLFLCLFLFIIGLAYWSDPSSDLDTRCFKLCGITQGYSFWGPHDGRPHL